MEEARYDIFLPNDRVKICGYSDSAKLKGKNFKPKGTTASNIVNIYATIPSCKLTPKFHKILHYWENALEFGPIYRHSSYKYERFHQLNKRSISTSKNMKNPSYSMKFEFFCRLIEIFPEWLTDPPEIFYFYDLVRRMIVLIFTEPTESELKELQTLVKSFKQEIRKYDLITPKTHFLSHYPSLIEFYGCLTIFSTMAWERKHRMLKVLMQHSKNFKNVAKTLMILHKAKLACESISKPNEWPLDKNIVRQINDEKSNFILAKCFIKIGNKIMSIGGDIGHGI
ncbi:hypothetical protein DERF_003661 [Dermatophagoides farinae]|uniref:Uncharacterized protein n=1 Tax=Dermatophagoides farinae TaxID=6954 RepID=A0A922IF48_DERFA|nr:hypothetical protein DERF_003661 [Dermatophagoides farinae]